jgi:hypothetical protein
MTSRVFNLISSLFNNSTKLSPKHRQKTTGHTQIKCFFHHRWMMPTDLTQLWHPSDTKISCMCSKTTACSHSFILWFTEIKKSDILIIPTQVKCQPLFTETYITATKQVAETSTCMKPQYLVARLNPYRILQLRPQTFLLFQPAIYLSKKKITA